MAKKFTYLELKTQVSIEMDIQGETFVTPDELIGYFNRGIDSAKRIVLDLYEDYLLRSKTITLTSGKAEYTLPTDIIASKIRSLILNDGSQLYKVIRIRELDKFEWIADIQKHGLASDYAYYLEHQTGNKGIRIILVPESRVTGGVLDIWYLREPNKIPLTTEETQTDIDETIVDIPEGHDYILQFVRDKIREKDNLPPQKDGGGIPLINLERSALQSVLKPAVPDNDDTIQQDLSHYWDHS